MNDLPSEDAVILAEKEKYCQERCHFMLFDSVSFHPSLSTASRAASVAFSQVRAAKLVVAVTEPLEGVVRSQLGQKHCHSLMVAATEPLEGAVRSQLGHKPCHSLVAAVTEPLEGTVRSQLGQKPCPSLVVAVTEPLEGTVRALLGQKPCHSPVVAVTEPLEGVVRSQLGHKPCYNLVVAVGEPLEGTVRAQLGQSIYHDSINIFHHPHKSCTIFVIHVKRLKNEFRHQYAVRPIVSLLLLPYSQPNIGAGYRAGSIYPLYRAIWQFG